MYRHQGRWGHQQACLALPSGAAFLVLVLRRAGKAEVMVVDAGDPNPSGEVESAAATAVGAVPGRVSGAMKLVGSGSFTGTFYALYVKLRAKAGVVDSMEQGQFR